MDNGKTRINAGYRIINAISVGNKEYVLGIHCEVPNQFVTWECKNGTDYFLGHYLNTSLKAIKDLCERVMEEVQYLEQKEKDKYIEPYENQYCLIATVKHDGNTAVISIQLLHEQNSLRMVNELAKAVFHADYRVYERMERNLSKNLYSSPEDLLRDAVWYTNQVKNRDKQKRTEDRKER